MKYSERFESAVRSYCRSFPVVFDRAQGSQLFDEDGRAYLDFFAGAGALNYGHNPPQMKEALLEYINSDAIVHSLDMSTAAKERFLKTFQSVILEPRNMDYKLQFPGPTGTNAVEAALKLARKVTGRAGVLSFTDGFHGMTLGSLAVTGNHAKRRSAGVPLSDAMPMPFDGFLGDQVDTLDVLEGYLSDTSSGVSKPAAIILETIQAEGGVNVASRRWLQGLQSLCRRHGILLIVDDIQVGCGRTGSFFSFEDAGLRPDIICLSKSLSGYGLPFAVVLLRPELDVWEPGEHNGTFRGHNLAFVTATAALTLWKDDALQRDTQRKAKIVEKRLEELVQQHPDHLVERRGRGLIQGVEFRQPAAAQDVARRCFERGLVIETAGSQDQVVKLLPALTIEDDQLAQGLEILAQSVVEAVSRTSQEALEATEGEEVLIDDRASN